MISFEFPKAQKQEYSHPLYGFVLYLCYYWMMTLRSAVWKVWVPFVQVVEQSFHVQKCTVNVLLLSPQRSTSHQTHSEIFHISNFEMLFSLWIFEFYWCGDWKPWTDQPIRVTTSKCIEFSYNCCLSTTSLINSTQLTH